MLKVLYLINSPVPYGANVALYKTLEGLISKGIKPVVVMARAGKVCEWFDKVQIEYSVIRNYHSIYPPTRRILDYILYIPRLFRMILFNKLAEFRLEKLALDFNPDIIHTNIGPVHIGLKVAKKLKIKHVWHIREYQDLDFGMHAFPTKVSFKRKLNDPANHNIAITHDIYKYFNMSDRNSVVVYDGVLKKEQAQYIDQKKDYFLFVGRLEDAKGIRLLLEVFITFAQSNSRYKLFIAGTGQEYYSSLLKKMVEKSGLEDRIVFLGFRTDICQLMAEATVLLVPSRSEGFGFITVEAMFNGCLVFGYNSGGTREILKDNFSESLFSNKDELLNLMKELTKNGIEYYHSRIMLAQKQAIDMYSEEHHVEAVYNYYNRILKESNN
ncbi:glycosyltransferase family 4 protein [Dysgonomonas capnocytophagoides]|uniref:glycosyltransferase family 4 protein n=1 Tax=Dysgonomonas capnocytophagoides TaxID=45254 RepID=UPI00333FD537